MDRSPAFSVCQWNIPSAFYFFEIKKKSEPVSNRNQVRIYHVWQPWRFLKQSHGHPDSILPPTRAGGKKGVKSHLGGKGIKSGSNGSGFHLVIQIYEAAANEPQQLSDRILQ